MGAMKIYVGTFVDGSERVLRTLRGSAGLVSYETADEYLAKHVGSYFARLWRDAVDGKSRMRGVRWVGEGDLVSRPEESSWAIAWIRYCAEQVDEADGDPTLVELIRLSFNKKERELWEKAADHDVAR